MWSRCEHKSHFVCLLFNALKNCNHRNEHFSYSRLHVMCWKAQEEKKKKDGLALFDFTATTSHLSLAKKLQECLRAVVITVLMQYGSACPWCVCYRVVTRFPVQELWDANGWRPWKPELLRDELLLMTEMKALIKSVSRCQRGVGLAGCLFNQLLRQLFVISMYTILFISPSVSSVLWWRPQCRRFI